MEIIVHRISLTPGLRLLAALLCFSMPAAAQPEGVATALQAAVEGNHRLPENVGRDRYRHPVETLQFLELQPHHTVVEIWPAGGWYTEVIAPVVREHGRLYAAHFAPHEGPAYRQESRRFFQAKVESRQDMYGSVQITTLNPPEDTAIAPPGSADRVYTFRNVHNWMKAGTEDAVFQAMFKALKPGGLLGVVEHRAPPKRSRKGMVRSGYVTEDYVIEVARRAGFVLIDRSEINANPADRKLYPNGVWSLPPSLRGGETDREKYLAIGESDRMTLKFLKPFRSPAR